MADEFDINEVVASFIRQNIERFLDSARGVLKHTSDKLRLELDQTYSTYLRSLLDKHSRAKSFFMRVEPVYLYDYYVPLSLSRKSQSIPATSLSDISKVSRCATVVGTAGSGKSMLMKHLLLNAVLAKSRVPVFIELRQFNSDETDLFELILKTLSLHKFKLDREYTKKALRAGHFVLLLDGFDEVDHSRKKHVTEQVLEFVKTYDGNVVVMSSRPDSQIEGWPEFAILQVDPLTLDQAFELVTRLPFDSELKEKFLKQLRSGMFNSHRSFLSNPLLLSIMLLTYGESANIPSKMNVFYNQAYEALFERHDALKGGYQRERRTRLDVQDFARVFACFCVQTYDRRCFEFTRTEALAIIEKTKPIVSLDFDKEAFLGDAMQSACLLVEDGLSIVFSHRSFQEYFAARFIVDARVEVQRKLVQRYAQNVRTDRVLSLLFEMKPDVVEKWYLLPKLDELFKRIGSVSTIKMEHYLEYVRQCYSEFKIDADEWVAMSHQDERHQWSDVSRFALNACGSVVGWSGWTNKTAQAYFFERYCSEGKEKRIRTAELKMESAFLKDLSERGMFFSMETLRVLQAIRVALKGRARRARASLDAILAETDEVEDSRPAEPGV